MASILKVDTVNEVTSANGVTVDGLSIKDAKLVTADSVVTANITNDAVTLAKMASGTDGNIISYDTSGNPVAVATGSVGQVLTSAGAGAVPSFQAAAAGGKLLQVTYATYSTEKTFNSTSYVSLGLVGTITPSSTSSKIYVLISAQGTCDNNDNIGMKIDRNGTSVYATNGYFMSNQSGTARNNFPLMALDSPNSTSARTYTLYGLSTGGATVQTNEASAPTSITLMEIAG